MAIKTISNLSCLILGVACWPLGQNAVAACDGSNKGDIIFDNTQAPAGTPAVRSNFGFICSGSKSDTGVSGSSGNAINVSDFKVLDKKANGDLFISSGKQAPAPGKPTTVEENIYLEPEKKLTYFKAGQHLFDLDKYRAAADTLSNIPLAEVDADIDKVIVTQTNGTKTTIASGLKTYGTLTFQQFVDNVKFGATMYGIVRVKIPLYYDKSPATYADISACDTSQSPGAARLDRSCHVLADGTVEDMVTPCNSSATAGTMQAVREMVSKHNCFTHYSENMSHGSKAQSTTMSGGGGIDQPNTPSIDMVAYDAEMTTYYDNLSKGHYYCGQDWQNMAGTSKVMDNPRCVVQSDGSIIDIAGTKVATFCDSSGSNLCSNYTCLPGDIKSSGSLCNRTFDADSKVKVLGSLLWDFVDQDGNPLELNQLPRKARELYFKVEVPIMVNWDSSKYTSGEINDPDNPGSKIAVLSPITDEGTGVVTTMDSIADITPAATSTGAAIVDNKIKWDNVPQSSKDAYTFYNPSAPTLTATTFADLDQADRYHMLMPSGYAAGWAAAFNALNLTASDWTALGFTLPGNYTTTTTSIGAGGNPMTLTTTGPIADKDGITVEWTANDFRSQAFEDIPVYMYTGGLIDMHDHVNISGLLYVPQAMELEAKNTDTRQYINGGVIIRDGFFIETNGSPNSSITLIVADDKSYSTAVINQTSTTSGFIANKSTPTKLIDKADSLSALTQKPLGYNDANRANDQPAPPLWVEIQPNL